jgi:hypothetical protein
MELAAKCVFIYGLQQLTGKILISKNLGNKIRTTDDCEGATIWADPTVTASVMITRFNFGRKVRCHKWAVEKVEEHGGGALLQTSNVLPLGENNGASPVCPRIPPSWAEPSAYARYVREELRKRGVRC